MFALGRRRVVVHVDAGDVQHLERQRVHIDRHGLLAGADASARGVVHVDRHVLHLAARKVRVLHLQLIVAAVAWRRVGRVLRHQDQRGLAHAYVDTRLQESRLVRQHRRIAATKHGFQHVPRNGTQYGYHFGTTATARLHAACAYGCRRLSGAPSAAAALHRQATKRGTRNKNVLHRDNRGLLSVFFYYKKKEAKPHRHHTPSHTTTDFFCFNPVSRGRLVSVSHHQGPLFRDRRRPWLE